MPAIKPESILDMGAIDAHPVRAYIPRGFSSRPAFLRRPPRSHWTRMPTPSCSTTWPNFRKRATC